MVPVVLVLTLLLPASLSAESVGWQRISSRCSRAVNRV